MKIKRTIAKGFTLIEMMLVTSIIAMVLYMALGYVQQRTLSTSIDRSSIQIQQVLNAGLSFYVNNGTWPASVAALQTAGYLPGGIFQSPWGIGYTTGTTTNNLFQVSLSIPTTINNSRAIGLILAGKIPLGTSVTIGANEVVTGSVNIPAQNLSNAGNVQFAGLYRNGACVPVPTCPVDSAGNTLEAQIMAVPVSVSGMNYGSTEVYPLSSFTAYSSAPAMASGTAGPAACGTNTTTTGVGTACYANAQGGTLVDAGMYWRVCLQVVTSEGAVTWTNTTGQFATILAITRCAPPAENVGSSFNVFAF